MDISGNNVWSQENPNLWFNYKVSESTFSTDGNGFNSTFPTGIKFNSFSSKEEAIQFAEWIEEAWELVTLRKAFEFE